VQGESGQSDGLSLGSIWRTAQQLAKSSKSTGAAIKDERQLKTVLR
jgi:hypothetical protein